MTYEEIIKLVDERIDMQTDIIMESDWFDEKVQEAVKSYLETNQLWNNTNSQSLCVRLWMLRI